MKTKFRAFSLTELLIVLGILAVLAAILLPVFFTGRESARRASCQINLRSIGNALQNYCTDYDETYPPSSQMVTVNGYGEHEGENAPPTWDELVTPYLHKTLPFCPDRVTPKPTKEGLLINPNGIGYAFNSNLCDAVLLPANQTVTVGVPENTVGSPALTVAVFDARVGLLARNAPDTNDTDPDGEKLPPGATRHNGGASYLFADGHVKWFKPDGLQIDDKSDGTHPGFGL